jgi:predicted transposase YdaD
MAETDSPLKQLVTCCIAEFAAWVMKTDISSVTPCPVELQPSTTSIDSDLIFEVTTNDNQTVLLHFEFQGPKTHKPMHIRMLHYMTRMTDEYRGKRMINVVLYVGQGAGQHDTGEHHTYAPDGTPALSWRYQVIHLWRMEAEELLAVGHPGLLALVGQTRIREPHVVIPQVVKRLKAVENQEKWARLFSALLTLTGDSEVLTMIEQLIEDENILLDTPFLQRICKHEREEVREEVREEGARMMLRAIILETVRERFMLAKEIVASCEQALATVINEDHLRALFKAALQATSYDAFQAYVPERSNGHR